MSELLCPPAGAGRPARGCFPHGFDRSHKSSLRSRVGRSLRSQQDLSERGPRSSYRIAQTCRHFGGVRPISAAGSLTQRNTLHRTRELRTANQELTTDQIRACVHPLPQTVICQTQPECENSARAYSLAATPCRRGALGCPQPDKNWPAKPPLDQNSGSEHSSEWRALPPSDVSDRRETQISSCRS